MFKFIKGAFYPELTGTISDTMSRRFESQLTSRDAQIFKDCKTWAELYKIASHNGLRWRWGFDEVLKPKKTFSMKNPNSKVLLTQFY